MGVYKWVGLFLVLFLFFSPLVLSVMDDADKAYLDGLNQKTQAQISAKIDAQTTRIENNLKTSIAQTKAELSAELGANIKDSLKTVAIGLVGLIIITLAIFKVIDLRISSTRNIKKYEKFLQSKTEEFNKLIMSANNERNELALVRYQMIEFQKKLQDWEKNLLTMGGGQSLGYGQQISPTFPSSFPSPPNKSSVWKIVAIIFIVILILIFGYIAFFRLFIMGGR
jgi:hypothetical protein